MKRETHLRWRGVARPLRRLGIGLLLLLLAGGPGAALAQDQRDTRSETETVTTVPTGMQVTDDFFLTAGEYVEILGTLDADLLAAGGQVLIEGTVNGDAIFTGGTAYVAGTVNQDVRVAGGQINISGRVEGSVIALGGNVEITPGAEIGGGVLVIGGAVTVLGPVGGDLNIWSGSAIVSSMIGGDLQAYTERLRLTSGAVVSGDLVYSSATELDIDDQAVVTGARIARDPLWRPSSDWDMDIDWQQLYFQWNLFWSIVGFLSALIFGLLWIRFLPRYTAGAVQALRNRPMASFGIGIAALLLTPLLLVLLLITVIGIPLAGILFLTYLLMLYLAKIYVGYFVGLALLRQTDTLENQNVAFVLGLFVVYLLMWIPVLGMLLQFLALCFGLGAALLNMRERYRDARQLKLV